MSAKKYDATCGYSGNKYYSNKDRYYFRFFAIHFKLLISVNLIRRANYEPDRRENLFDFL